MRLLEIKVSEIVATQKKRDIYVQELVNSKGNASYKNEIKDRIQDAEDRIDSLTGEISTLEANK